MLTQTYYVMLYYRDSLCFCVNFPSPKPAEIGDSRLRTAKKG